MVMVMWLLSVACGLHHTCNGQCARCRSPFMLWTSGIAAKPASRGLSGRAGLQGLTELERMRHGLVQRFLVELAFGEADDDAGDAVAHQVGQRAAFAHEFVDADQD